MNQINVIRPFSYCGQWVFDDADKGLNKEPLVGGIPEMLELALSKSNIKDKFLLFFSDGPFPGSTLSVDWVREEMSGNIYRWEETNMEGWLCPALLRYFVEAPAKIYIGLKEE